MLITTIIPTIGRKSLSNAVYSVLDQDFDQNEFEVIVVNDSGLAIPTHPWHSSPVVKIINTNKRERSVARNAGAAVARGKYLHFLDDDDWMMPTAFESFGELANTSKAAWLYGGYRFVNHKGKVMEDCFPDESGNCFIRFLAGEWLPLQASIIDRQAFFSVGGFASLESLLGGDEDIDLARQISLYYEISGTSDLVATILVDRENSTTNYTNLRSQSRQSREKALDAPGAYSRMRSSAYSRSSDVNYWLGRIVWNYLSSVQWNLQHGKPLTAVSRLLYGVAGFTMAGGHILSAKFWRGATRGHKAKGWLVS